MALILLVKMCFTVTFTYNSAIEFVLRCSALNMYINKCVNFNSGNTECLYQKEFQIMVLIELLFAL